MSGSAAPGLKMSPGLWLGKGAELAVAGFRTERSEKWRLCAIIESAVLAATKPPA